MGTERQTLRISGMLLMAVSSLTVTFNTLLLRGFVPPSKQGAVIRS